MDPKRGCVECEENVSFYGMQATACDYCRNEEATLSVRGDIAWNDPFIGSGHMTATTKQRDKLIALATRYNHPNLLREAKELKVDDEVKNNGISAWYGKIYICTLEDGSSHS